MKLLTDEEYAEHMNRKLLKTEADIALLDDRIQELKDSQSSGDSSPSETKRKDP
jgi:hypothetical protein